MSATLEQQSVLAQFTQPPIVVCGCGRSGTSLLLSVLSCHPSIYAIPNETRLLAPPGDPLDDVLLNAHASAHRWCEKTPSNVHHIPAILDAHPGARILHIVRDGRDVVTSRHPDVLGFYVPFERWIKDVSIGLEHSKLAEVMTVRYEDLVCDYVTTIERVCGFLDEALVPELMDYPHSATVGSHAAWGSRAIPIHANVVGRWRNPVYRPRVNEFLREPLALPLLRTLGYEA